MHIDKINHKSSFNLHSIKNRHLYPPAKYPLTYLLDNKSIQRRLSKQSTYVEYFKYTSILLLLFVLISIIFFQSHIYLYNSLFGPFHQNLEEFTKHVHTHQNIKSWFWRKEYIQIELGENNIQNPVNKYDSIKKYSNSFTQQRHIATYKKAKKPNIYIKLPTQSEKHFHKHFPFEFSLFSIETLQCILKNLQSNPQTTYKIWTEKFEYVKYINEEYKKNSTLFNMLVLTKCGILIGYLYKPLYEKAFIRNRQHRFYTDDIAFDTTRQYYSYYLLLFGILIFLWFFLKSSFYLLIYLSNIIRYKLYFKYDFLSFSLYLSSDVLKELWILNLDGLPHQQLLQLDELIQRTEHKIDNQLFIIENHLKELYVVLLKTKLYENHRSIQNDLSPFVICPVNDIKKIVHNKGIYVTQNSSWIPWPSTMTREQNYSEWLHEELMDISECYRHQFEDRLRNERQNQPQHMQNFSDSNIDHRRSEMSVIETIDERKFEELVQEEENFQDFRFERQYLSEPTTTASPEFIAKFRMEQILNQDLVDSTMEKEELICMVCLNNFELHDSYTKWPCLSQIPHLFHFNCMLKTLRISNTCPICRHAVEARQIIPHVL